MICFRCQSKPCVCHSELWNHLDDKETVEKFDAFVKSLQKNPGLVQREEIDHYIAQLQEIRRNPAHVVTSISVDSLGGLGHGVPFQIGQGRLERTRERREFGGRGYFVYGQRVVPDHQEPVYPHHRQMMNPNRWAGKCSPFPLLDAERYSSPEWEALFDRLARQPGVSRFLAIPEPKPRTLEEMPVDRLAVTVRKLLEERRTNKQRIRDNPHLFNIQPVDYLPRMGNTIDYLEVYRKMANVRSHLPAYSLDNIMQVDFRGEPRVSVDFELCDEVGLPIEPAERERRAGIVVLSQKARQANIALQYQVLGGGFPRDGVPLLHSGLVCDEEHIFPRTTGKTMSGIGSLMDGLRAKRKKQHNRKFWVDRQQPAWAGGRKKGKR